MEQLDMRTGYDIKDRLCIKMRTGHRVVCVRSMLSLLLIITLMISLTGCNTVPSARPYLSENRDTQWVNDIAYLEKALPKVHKNLHFHLSKQEFQQELNDLKSKIPDYTDEQMEIALSIVMASIGDTHTGSNIGVESMYPLELHWFAEGIYIMGTSEEYKELLGARIITLNRNKIEVVADTLRPLLAGANESWFKTQIIYYLTIPGVLKHFDLSQSDGIELNVELQNGQMQTVKLNPVNSEDFVAVDQTIESAPLCISHPDENYWYEYLEENKAVYLNYSSCRQMRDKPFELFEKEFWNFIQSHEVDKLVLDLRENRGGSSTILDSFIKKVKNSDFNQEGKLYVMIGKDTYSSAVLNAVSLKEKTQAYFVGEATGGEPNHYGEVKQFTLPNSQIPIRYSTKHFHWLDQDVDTLEPDKVIEETHATYQAGIDPVLEWILEQN